MKLVPATLTERMLPASSKLGQIRLGRKLRHYLAEEGWFQSIQAGLPVDGDGNPLPWMTYSSIAFLEGCVRPGMAIFEFGSGNSTLWWSSRAARVVSYEHDLQWRQVMKDQLPENVEYHHREADSGEYAEAIRNYSGEFDVVVIDGADRVNCARNCLGALREGGLIVWDNSDLDEYADGYAFLTENGFKRLDFQGIGPINAYPWQTSIFYRAENCFGI